VLKALLAFLSAVPGSVRGVVTHAEQIRTLLTALSAGSVPAILMALAGLFGVTLPLELVTVVTPVVVAIVDYLRRKYFHGTPPAAPPSPRPAA
jgi:hypothetical protein